MYRYVFIYRVLIRVIGYLHGTTGCKLRGKKGEQKSRKELHSNLIHTVRINNWKNSNGYLI